VETERYWTPTHDPVDRPFSYFVDRFTDLFQQVLSEWTRDDLDYGVLLSGGSDSRLVLAGVDQEATVFHIADWMSREAKTAKRAADAADTDCVLLERDEMYQAQALTRNPSLANFSGWFDQAYFSGFDDEIASEVDVLLSGLYADMLFKGGPLDTSRLPLGPIGSISIPVWKDVESIDEYVAQQTAAAKDPPSYFTPPLDIEAVVKNNIRRTDDGIVSHGIEYESLRDLVMYGEYHPIGADTDAIFSRSLMQICPYRTPFLDARILEFQQQVPIKYMLRRNIIARAVERLSPELADVPHARTGISLKYPFAVEYLGGHINGFRRKHFSRDSPPRAHLTHGPWMDREALIQHRDFLISQIREREDLIRDLPFLDYEGVMECYDTHLDGEDQATLLYSLATLLEMPATEFARQSDRATTTLPQHLNPRIQPGEPPEVVTDE
jgi:asparagine synthase (glutamine-hydrolysing)